MRICILSEYFHPDSTGGTGTVLSKLVRQLKDQHENLEIDVITSRNLFRGEAGSLSRREEWQGVRIFRLGSPVPRKKSVRRRLMANMVFTGKTLSHLLRRRQRYDLVLVVTAPPTLPLAARLYSKWRGVPYIYLVYDLYLDMAVALQLVSPESKVMRVMKQVQQDWFQKASETVVLGRCMRDHVETAYQVSETKISVVPIPANVDQIVPLAKDTRFRADNGLEGFVVLYAGNFAQYQDFDTLLDAAAILKDRADIKFVFVGDGAKRESIAARIEDENLENVRLLPFVPEAQLCDLLASADVSLVTLERGIEGLAVPSKFYNIMASGRPTLACVPKSCEVALVVDSSGCGIHVDQENPRALAEAVLHLADNPEVAAQMGRNARQVCEERYGLATISQQFYSIFNKVVLNNSASPSPVIEEVVNSPHHSDVLVRKS